MGAEAEKDAGALARGMAEQLAALRAARAAGMPRAGWKLGFNAPEMQRRIGLDAPALGWLDGRSVLASGARYAAPASARIHVEAELALRIGRDVRAGDSLEACRAAIAEISPALELVDYARPRSDLRTMLAHSMFHAATVLGTAFAPTRAGELASDRPQLAIGSVLLRPVPGWVPREPAECVAHAARFLAEYGEGLVAGDLLLSGSFTAPAALAPGETARADFGPLGSVSVTLAPAAPAEG